jgi:hypothetical protein
MSLTRTEVMELIERSKRDDEIIVGSDVRMLGQLALEALDTRGGFADALRLLKQGKAVTRKSWNGMAYLLVQVPDKGSKMTDPYIYMVTGPDFNIRCPYSPNQTDLLTSEWVEA